MGASNKKNSMNGTTVKISSLESLRGYLALWVFACHLLSLSGTSQLNLPFFSALTNASHAVKVFMILSGFVIALLLESKNEPYRLYITRRFIRLYPVLFLAILAGILSHFMRGVLITSFWPNFFEPNLLANFQKSWTSHDKNFWSCAVSVLTMTNGLISNHVIPYAATAFNGVVWSLSLEFQFYLVAPLLLRSIKPLAQRLVWSTFLIIAVVITRHKIFPVTENGLEYSTFGAFLPFNIEYFWLGILSYYLWNWFINAMHDRSSTSGKSNFSLLSLTVALTLLIAGEKARPFLKGNVLSTLGDWIPFLIWLLVFANILDIAKGSKSLINKLADHILHSKVAMFFGRISYSLYLLHSPIIIIVQYLVVRKLEVSDWKTCLLYTSLLAIPLTVVISALSYRYIEQPFIALGRRIKSQKHESAL